jgi:hypothetical protein
MGDSQDIGHDLNGQGPSSRIANSVRGFFESIAGSGSDPTNPVINGASVQERPFLARILADIASQAPRLGENLGLIHSLVDTKFLDGGIVDDRQYQVWPKDIDNDQT